MNSNEFRKAAHAAVDESMFTSTIPPTNSCFLANSSTVIDYYDTIGDRRVVSNVEPGYLRKLLPTSPPEEGEQWADIQKDIEAKIMPGLTHWFVNYNPLTTIAKLKLSRTKAIP